jgi:DNA-binding NarL/FixJ family response regulator
VCDYEVLAVPNGQAWREHSKARSVALCVLSVPRHRTREEFEQEFQDLMDSGRGPPTIVLSGVDELRTIVEALERGAKGYISTSMPLDVAIAAIRFVSAGGTFVPAESILAAARQRTDQQPATMEKANGLFTARQAAVVEALRKGKANKLIAYELNMCESTVKVHVRKIMRKLKAANRTEVAYLANEFMNRSMA